MLMRYAENFAGGHGFVWNTGGPPVDGATDFLFMTTVAGLIKLGMPTGRAVRLLGLGAHIATVLLVYGVNRRMWNAGVLASLLTALYLAVGTGLWYVAAYFGTTFFALSIGLLLMHAESPGRLWIWIFSVCCLLAGLIRPEGALLSLFIMASIICFRGWRGSNQIVRTFIAVMLLGGGAYFTWHWNYFGHPLPNPYYKKGGGLLHWDSFWESLRYLIRFAGPFGLAFILGLRRRGKRLETLAHVVPLLAFAALFILISNETNFGGRFQYALWPMALLSFYPLVRGLPQEEAWSRKPDSLDQVGRAAWILAGLTVCTVLLLYAASQACTLTVQQRSCGIAYEADGRYDVARMLAEYRGRGYVLATSEAGLLPLYSGWKTIDTWGLNDPWIALNGEITFEYLDEFRPQVIVFHAYFSPLVPPRTNPNDLANAWHRMTLTLKEYAESRDYLLAAAFGDSPYESHYYYVRSDFPESARIARQLARLRSYTWYASGKKAINYAQFGP
jgi:arabinofuranosyltransferase